MHQFCNLLKKRGVVADAHCAMMRGRGGKPLFHIGIQIHAEINMRLGVADGEDVKLLCYPFAHDEAQVASHAKSIRLCLCH